jgi:hypothetical protein
MHQTVLTFFSETDGTAAKSANFNISNVKYAHVRLSVICIRYLMLCAVKSLHNEPRNIESWDSDNFEAYARHINERPFLNYIISHLNQHIDSCRQDATVSRCVSQLASRLIGNTAFFLLESWVDAHLNISLPPHELNESAENFRNQILHAATSMRFSRVVEVSLRVGAQVEARLHGKTPLIVSAGRGDDITVQLLIDWVADKEAKDTD